jgi:hypothetical protein
MPRKRTTGGGCAVSGCDLAREADAQRIRERVQRVPVTPQCLAENAAKQASYEQRRWAWIAECNGQNQEQTSAALESPAKAPQNSESNSPARLLALVFKNASTSF